MRPHPTLLPHSKPSLVQRPHTKPVPSPGGPLPQFLLLDLMWLPQDPSQRASLHGQLTTSLPFSSLSELPQIQRLYELLISTGRYQPYCPLGTLDSFSMYLFNISPWMFNKHPWKLKYLKQTLPSQRALPNFSSSPFTGCLPAMLASWFFPQKPFMLLPQDICNFLCLCQEHPSP